MKKPIKRKTSPDEARIVCKIGNLNFEASGSAEEVGKKFDEFLVKSLSPLKQAIAKWMEGNSQ